MSEIGGLSVGSFFNKAASSIAQEGKDLQAKIDSLGKNKNIEQQDLLQIQFAMGQYNAKLEATSALTKSMLDTMKSLAQRQG